MIIRFHRKKLRPRTSYDLIVYLPPPSPPPPPVRSGSANGAPVSVATVSTLRWSVEATAENGSIDVHVYVAHDPDRGSVQARDAANALVATSSAYTSIQTHRGSTASQEEEPAEEAKVRVFHFLSLSNERSTPGVHWSSAHDSSFLPPLTQFVHLTCLGSRQARLIS